MQRLATAALGIVLLIGCSDSLEKAETLSVGIGAEPSDLDPQITTSVAAARISESLFEGLVTLDSATLEPLPGVARMWESSADGRSWIFHLRPASWSDGVPLTAADFVFSFKRFLSPALGSEYAYMLFPIRNAEAFNKGEIDFDAVGIRSPSPDTLEIELEHPVPYFLSLLARPFASPVPRHVIERFGDPNIRGTRWTRTGNHVSNGPFRLRKWSLAEFVEVERNPHYFDAKNVKLDRIRFWSIVDQNTEERAFLTNQLQATYTIPQGKVAEWIRSGDPRLRVDPELGTYYFALNVRVPPLGDTRVRRALALAMDREAIAAKVRQRGETAAQSFTPPGTAGYSPPRALQHHPGEARELLAQAGFPDGQGFPELTLLFNESDTHRNIAEAVQAMWKDNLDIQVNLQSIEWKALLQERKLRNFEILRAGWIGDFNDPATFLKLWTSDSANNHSGWSNARYDELIEHSTRESNPTKRFEIFSDAESILLDELPILPVFHYNRIFLIDPKLLGWDPNLIGYCRWKQIHFQN